MKYLCFFSFLILFSCTEKEEVHVISKNQFKVILKEIYLKGPEYQSYKINNLDYQLILSDHNVSKTDFENTLQYYSERPDLLENIYEEILIELEETRNQLN